jgi:hypothetical protein
MVSPVDTNDKSEVTTIEAPMLMVSRTPAVLAAANCDCKSARVNAVECVAFAANAMDKPMTTVANLLSKFFVFIR